MLFSHLTSAHFYKFRNDQELRLFNSGIKQLIN